MIERTLSINIFAWITLVSGILFILAPIIIAFTSATLSYEAFVAAGGMSIQFGGHFWDNLLRIWHDTRLPAQLWNSVVISFMVAFTKCALAFTATFALVFYQSRLNTIVFALTIATVMLPLDLIVIATYQVVSNVAIPLNWLLNIPPVDTLVTYIWGSVPYFNLNMIDSYMGVVAPIATSCTSVFIYRQFFLSLPKDLPRAATMDGAGPIRFMIDILLPLSKTPLIATFMFWFIGGWTAYLWPLVATSVPEAQPAVVGLAKLATQDPEIIPDVPLLMTGALFVSFVPVLLIAVMQRQIIKGLNLSEK